MNCFKMKSLLKNKFRIIILFSLLALPILSFSQGKEANIWYFGAYAGVDFNAGSPPDSLTDSQMLCDSQRGSASIADSMGNLLFYTNGREVWNRNHTIMPNANDIGCVSTQGAIIIPKDKVAGLYYIFNFGYNPNSMEFNFTYSIIDMNLDNGNGDAVTGSIELLLVDNTSWHISAVKHANYNDFWVVCHGYNNNYYYSFLVTKDSIYPPVESYTNSSFTSVEGYMKISPNGKKIAAALYRGGDSFFELLDFNNETGDVSDMNYVSQDGIFKGVEFSPDNTKLYVNGSHMLYQYDLEAGSPLQILESGVNIAISGEGALQLGPDGIIYCVVPESGHEFYLSVINNPNLKAPACSFQWDAIDLHPNLTNNSLPTFIQSYLNDPNFSWQNTCFGETTLFTIDDVNGVDSVFWNFGDFGSYPNNTSTLFMPTHVFSQADTFNVTLTVYSGLIEKQVTKQVVVYPSPQPNLGSDTLLCSTPFSIELDATCNAVSYVWHDMFGVTTPQITVSDTGTYIVTATNSEGCSGTDSIAIELTPQPVVDISNLVITNAGCGLQNGEITGIQVTVSTTLLYTWIDQYNDTIGHTLDITGLGAGTYTLMAFNSNGCDHNLGDYIVDDNGSLTINSVTFSDDHCNLSSGEIIIDESNTGNIFYSIYGDSAWVQNSGVFTGVTSGDYLVAIKDNLGCIEFYNGNPVVINNIGGPQVSSVSITPDVNNLSTGSIGIAAAGTGDISYSIYSGSNPQINNGLFTNLSAGLYNCYVSDTFGCDTSFTAYVPQNATDTLLAISGFGNSCEGEAAVIPLQLVNFNDVYSFNVNLNYDVNIVICDGYQKLNPLLEDGFTAYVSTSTGEVHLQWQGTSPLTIADDATMCELIFRGLGEGISPVNWESGPAQSAFYDINHDPINASYFKGEIEVYSNPDIASQPQAYLCSGESLNIDPEVSGGNGTINYLWSGPDGFASDNKQVNIASISTEESGTYILSVEDSMTCSNTQSFMVNVYASPQIAFAAYDTLWMEPGDILEAGTNYAYLYSWNTGETTPAITIDTCGTYSVEVVSPENCSSQKSVMILWDGIPFYIPNAFTPDGDGLNDVFNIIPKYDYIRDFRLTIFNRWGQQIFTTRDYNKGWDGTFKGSPCMVGAYIYKVTYSEFSSPGAKSVEGSVVVVR